MSMTQAIEDETLDTATFTGCENTDPEYDAWFRRKVMKGEKAYLNGQVITQEEATRRAEQRRTLILKMAEAK